MAEKEYKPSEFSLINYNYPASWRNAPVLDAYVALLEEPEYILYLGDRELVNRYLDPYKPTKIMKVKDYRKELLGRKYYKCKGHIDCNNKYRFKLGKYSPSSK
jgi:hypothetical protein